VEQRHKGRYSGQVGARLVDLVKHLAHVERGGRECESGDAERDEDANAQPERDREGDRDGERARDQGGGLDIDPKDAFAAALARELRGTLMPRCPAGLASTLGVGLARLPGG
jgi:hypothetical protein